MTERPDVLVLAPIPPELRSRLSARYTLVELDRGADRLSSFPVAVTTSVIGADQALLDRLPGLRLLTCNGTGLDKIDLDAAQARNVEVRHTPDVVTEDTADFALALMYAVSRRVAEADRFVRSGRWRSERMTPSRRLYDKRLGIVGLGKIGSAIARRAAGIGMDVSYTGPRPKVGVPYRFYGSPAELAASVDILVLSCPGGAETDGIVNADVLDRLGKDGMLINVSRGTVVDEEALIAALQGGTILAAGLDVFKSEPDIDPRFLALENVVLQPHYAAVTRETRAAMADVIEGAIDRFFAGERHAASRAAYG